MPNFRTKVTKSKNTHDVTTSNTQIFQESSDLEYNFIFIQNTGDTPLWISLGENASSGTNGEIKLVANADISIPYQGDIFAIRGSASSNVNNCTVIGY